MVVREVKDFKVWEEGRVALILVVLDHPIGEPVVGEVEHLNEGGGTEDDATSKPVVGEV